MMSDEEDNNKYGEEDNNDHDNNDTNDNEDVERRGQQNIHSAIGEDDKVKKVKDDHKQYNKLNANNYYANCSIVQDFNKLRIIIKNH